MTKIETSLFAKLCQVFGNDRVYPEQIPMQENNDDGSIEPNTLLPAASYRLVSGDTIESLTGKTGFATDSFLIEVFDRTPDVIQEIRSKLFDEFKGPPDKDRIGFPKKWEDNGVIIQWAVATNPAVDTEITTKDAHDVLRYIQLLLTIDYFVQEN